jgi:hypothetical protein
LTQHVADLAELYACGALDDLERARVDAHVRTCAACAAEIGQAEAVAAMLVPPADPPTRLDRRIAVSFAPRARRSPWFAAAAAAFVIGLLPGFALYVAGRGGDAFDADRRSAVRAMVSSHFAHAQCVAAASPGLKAKVIYARTGGWVYAVAQTREALHLQVYRGGTYQDAGALHAEGDAAELFVSNPRSQNFRLTDASGRAVATCALSAKTLPSSR